MSFVRTLATLAVGFAAAKGVERFQKAGGLATMKDALRGAGQPGGMADQMGAMAEKLGLPGGAGAVRDMMGRFGSTAAQATEQAELGMSALMASMTGAAAAGARNMGDMLGTLAGATPAGPLAEPSDIAGLAAAVGDTARAQVYSAALMAITVDTEAEKAYLRGLATALGLDAATVATIHVGAGKPQP